MKNRITKHISSEQGVVSILALLVMMLLLALGGAMLTVSSSEMRTASGFRDGVAAQYAAEAGAKRALLDLSTHNGNLSVVMTNEPVAPGVPGTYSITVEQKGINRVITSTGKVGSAYRQIVLEVAPETVYDYVVYSGSDLTLGINRINGSVGSNSNINFTAITWVYGDVIAHGNVKHPWFDLNYIRGREVSKAPALSIPDPSSNRSTFEKNGLSPSILPIIFTDAYAWIGPANLNNNVYYYNKNGSPLVLTLNNITGPGIIYSTGNIDIGLATVSNNVILISEKDINVPLGTYIDNSALVAKGNIEISISDFNGSAVAGGTITTPANFMAHPSKSNWTVTKNPYIPQPPLWQSERVKVSYWDNQQLN